MLYEGTVTSAGKTWQSLQWREHAAGPPNMSPQWGLGAQACRGPPSTQWASKPAGGLRTRRGSLSTQWASKHTVGLRARRGSPSTQGASEHAGGLRAHSGPPSMRGGGGALSTQRAGEPQSTQLASSHLEAQEAGAQLASSCFPFYSVRHPSR